MKLPPLPLPLPPGWTIDASHPSSTYLHEDSALPYLEAHLSQAPSDAILDFIAANTAAVFASPAFLTASPDALAAVLAHESLSLPEDAVLASILRRATAQTGTLSPRPALWSPDEREAMLRVLAPLVKHVAFLSLTPSVFLRFVEPLDLLSTATLTAKYRHDALVIEALAAGRSERDVVVETYGTSAALRPPPGNGPRVRLRSAFTESPHPYEPADENELERVAVDAWAGRVVVEFDRRSCVGEEARLSFYADSAGQVVLGDWAKLWRDEGVEASGRKFVVFDSHHFWVGFKCPATPAKGFKWGWKLRATPVIDDDCGE